MRLSQRLTALLFLLLPATTWALDPAIAPLTLAPAAITVGNPTSITVSALILAGSPSALVSTVSLLQVDQAGRTISVLATLNDSGVNGDTTVGDGIYSGSFTVSPSSAGSLLLQVSAGFRGTLLRTTSPIATLPVFPLNTPITPRAFDVGKLITNTNTNNTVVCDELLVAFKQSGTSADINAALSSVSATIAGQFPEIGTYQLVLPSCSLQALLNAQSTLQALPQIQTVDIATSLSPHSGSYIPNDPLEGTQWNVSQVNLPAAWSTVRTGAPVGIIDDGVNLNHEDLVGRVIGGMDWCATQQGTICIAGPTPSAHPGDYHGTVIAGIAAATSDNSVGIAGAAFLAPIIAERVVASNRQFPPAIIVNAIVDAVKKGVRVLNISLGCASSNADCPGVGSYLQRAIQYALDRRVVVVASAGNSNSTVPVYPAAYPGVIAVGASNQNNDRSNWVLECATPDLTEPASNYGSWVDLYAPGTNIIALSSTANSGPTTAYINLCQAGTSSAAPLVAGTVALMLKANPSLSPTQVKAALKASVQHTGKTDPLGNEVVILDAAQSVSASILVSGNGWRMSGYNGQHTNQSISKGPSSKPIFQAIVNSPSGSLQRISTDGSLILFNSGSGYLASFSSAGSPRWQTNIPISYCYYGTDLVIGPDGTIYTIGCNAISAWNRDTGVPVWSADLPNSGNERGGVAVDGSGNLYVNTGASYYPGPPQTLTSIAPTGVIRWQASFPGRGYFGPVLSTDERLVYISDFVVVWTRSTSARASGSPSDHL